MRRRDLMLGGLGLAAAWQLPFAPLLAEPTPTGRRFVFCLFEGGWDVLLGPDARDPGARYAGIDLGTELLAAAYRTPVEATIGGRSMLWGAPMQSLLPHTDVLTLFRGVNMNTVAHNTALPYVNTFRSPAGSTARGSSLGAKLATSGSLGADGPSLPFVSLGMPVYNVDLPVSASGVQFDRATDIHAMLAGATPRLSTSMRSLVTAARDANRSCAAAEYRGANPDVEQRLSTQRLTQIEAMHLASSFDFTATTPEMRALKMQFGFAGTATTPGLQAAAASQLIRLGLSRAVAVRLSSKHDTHTVTWADVQPVAMESGFEGLAALLDALRIDDPLLANTTVVATSEFARTPRLNGQRGRDHWFANSFLVFGGLRPGVFGETGQQDLGLVRVNATTGMADSDPAALQLMPEHVGATIAAAAGLPTDEFRVDPIASLLPGGV